jgi:GntP family gluconate:H+ symporter
MILFAQATAVGVSLWPFGVLVICLAAIVLMITRLRFHPFLALIFAAMLAGLLARQLPGEYGTTDQPSHERSHWVQAVELTATELGKTAGKIAIVIALAAVIGMCLMESGAADKVVRRFLKLFGEKRAGDAIAASSYIMSIPIFFDTFFMLLLPLARAMRVRTGKDYVLFTMAICCGGVVTHSLIAPHPGPLAMAETLKVDLGATILAGLILGIIPTLASWHAVKIINQRMEVPLRETMGGSVENLENTMAKQESELPSLAFSLAPVLSPLLLIALASIFAAIPNFKEREPGWFTLVEFLGNRNVALIVGTVFAVLLMKRQLKISLEAIFAKMGPPLETAGMIILITSAGGAFGLMLKNAGVGEAIQALASGHHINLIVLAWTVAAIIRLAQGSATVAMLTTAAMISPLIEAQGLPYHKVYLFAGIGFGAMIFSWMNDSGFWVVGRLSGFNEKETLKTWSIVTTVNSVTGLIVTLLASFLLPMATK